MQWILQVIVHHLAGRRRERPVLGDQCEIFVALRHLHGGVNLAFVVNLAGIGHVGALFLPELRYPGCEPWTGRTTAIAARAGTPIRDDRQWAKAGRKAPNAGCKNIRKRRRERFPGPIVW